MIQKHKKSIVVIGNGMVGHRFCERLVEYDTNHDYQIMVFDEEPRPVYDRVQLTSYFAHRDPAKLQIAHRKWYEERHIALWLGDPVVHIDRANRLLRSASGKEVHHDFLILATGSAPFVPPVPGIDKKGVFVYRTIEDLEKITAFARDSKRCAVIGGGLLGLEAAKAAYKKLFFSLDGTRLIGGILVGDASDYGNHLTLCKSPKPLSMKPGELLVGKRDGAASGIAAIADEAQILLAGGILALVGAANIVWVVVAGYAMFWIIEKLVGNRVSPQVEVQGLDVAEMGILGYIDEDPTAPEGHLNSGGREPRAARVPPDGHKRFTVVVEGIARERISSLWSELCRPNANHSADFFALYRQFTLLEGNRFRFIGGDPEKLRELLTNVLRVADGGTSTVRTEIEPAAERTPLWS